MLLNVCTCLRLCLECSLQSALLKSGLPLDILSQGPSLSMFLYIKSEGKALQIGIKLSALEWGEYLGSSGLILL